MNSIITFAAKISEKDNKSKSHSLNQYTVVLKKWLNTIKLSPKEVLMFESELLVFNQELIRSKKKYLKIAIFGRVGVGKSSLLNSLTRQNFFDVSIQHGSTSREKYNRVISNNSDIRMIELIDAPGVSDVKISRAKQIGIRTAHGSDLILFVIDSDLTQLDSQLLQIIIDWDKPILFILNRIDNYSLTDRINLIKNIRKRLPYFLKTVELLEVAAAPREAYLNSNGYKRSIQKEPQITSLERALYQIIEKKGQQMITINILKEAHYLNYSIRRWRLQEGKYQAQQLTCYYALFKTVAIVSNPGMPLDLVTEFFLDIYLVVHLCQNYNLTIDQVQLKKIISKISIHAAFFGSSLLTVQILLAFFRQIPVNYNLLNIDSFFSIIIQVCLTVYTTYSVANLIVKYLERSCDFLPISFYKS